MDREGDNRCLRPLTNLFQNRDAADVRKPEVKDDQIVPVLGDRRHPLAARPGGHHPIAVSLKHHGDEPLDLRFVINHQGGNSFYGRSSIHGDSSGSSGSTVAGKKILKTAPPLMPFAARTRPPCSSINPFTI